MLIQTRRDVLYVKLIFKPNNIILVIRAHDCIAAMLLVFVLVVEFLFNFENYCFRVDGDLLIPNVS